MAFDGKNTIGVLIFTVIALLIGIPMLNGISNSAYENTNIYTKTNESIYFSDTNSSTASELKITTITMFRNGTTDFTSNLGTLYNFTKATSVIVIDGKQMHNGTYNLSYQYEPLNYVSSSVSRTLINLLPFFFALGVLAIALLFVYRSELMDLFN